jgi:hypothetical protein
VKACPFKESALGNRAGRHKTFLEGEAKRGWLVFPGRVGQVGNDALGDHVNMVLTFLGIVRDRKGLKGINGARNVWGSSASS